MSGRVHEESIRIRFADVDYARILYYPRLFHFCHVAMEGFFREAVGLPYDRLLEERRLGFPTVHTEAEYERPIPYGVVLVMAVTITHVGRTSAHFRYRARVAGEEQERARAHGKTVCVDMDAFRPVPVPDDIRRTLEEHLEDPGAA